MKIINEGSPIDYENDLFQIAILLDPFHAH